MSDATLHPMNAQTRLEFAFRLVQWATLAAVAWKIVAFVAMVRCYYSIPLHQAFFPTLLQSPHLLSGTYLGLLGTLAMSATTRSRQWRSIACWGALICSSVLCIHQGSYNDMTFTTAWWTTLWSVWLASRLDRDQPVLLLKRAAFLSRCIVSMILLGGAVGKWTSEYWSGQALYEIYFVDRDFWFFNLLRSTLEPQSLRSAATWYSRNVILVESSCGFGLWLLPARWAALLAVSVMTSIAVFSNFNLFSVLLSLIGLASVGLFVKRQS